jgi:hypothetical protein
MCTKDEKGANKSLAAKEVATELEEMETSLKNLFSAHRYSNPASVGPEALFAALQ